MPLHPFGWITEPSNWNESWFSKYELKVIKTNTAYLVEHVPYHPWMFCISNHDRSTVIKVAIRAFKGRTHIADRFMIWCANIRGGSKRKFILPNKEIDGPSLPFINPTKVFTGLG